MITSFLLLLAYSFVNLMVSFLPTGHLPVAITSAFAYFMGVLNSFSYVVPVDTLLSAAGVVLVFDGAMLVWQFVNWIIRKIPGMQ
jgi:hypothetical protein